MGSYPGMSCRGRNLGVKNWVNHKEDEQDFD